MGLGLTERSRERNATKKISTTKKETHVACWCFVGGVRSLNFIVRIIIVATTYILHLYIPPPLCPVCFAMHDGRRAMLRRCCFMFNARLSAPAARIILFLHLTGARHTSFAAMSEGGRGGKRRWGGGLGNYKMCTCACVRARWKPQNGKRPNGKCALRDAHAFAPSTPAPCWCYGIALHFTLACVPAWLRACVHQLRMMCAHNVRSVAQQW